MNDLASVGRAQLVERIRDLIQRDGPITFDRFMEMALYEPALGYYAGLTALPSGASGALADFQTSPQIHPIFGYLVSQKVVQIWKALGEPRPFVVAELGAGALELARQILGGLAEIVPDLDVVYHAVDVRDATKDAVARREIGGGDARLIGAGYDPHPNPLPGGEGNGGGEGTGRDPRNWPIVRWPDLATLAASVSGVHVVLSNEFFDALPVHRLIRVGGDLKEAYVDWGRRGFVERYGKLSDPALARLVEHRLGFGSEGWRGEACDRLAAILETVGSLVDRGAVLTIDYGYEAGDRTYPEGETLLAYYRHQWNDELFRRVGEQDLTSHVDVDRFLKVGAQFGLRPAEVTNQREFLRGLGFDDAASSWLARAATPGGQLQSRFAMAELIDSRGQGRLKVIAQVKGEVVYPPASVEST